MIRRTSSPLAEARLTKPLELVVCALGRQVVDVPLEIVALARERQERRDALLLLGRAQALRHEAHPVPAEREVPWNPQPRCLARVRRGQV
jgi:hypothetical protein